MESTGPHRASGIEPGLALAILAAAALRLWAIDFGLPYTEARPDESLLIEKARAVAHGDPNPHFFNYPSLFIYVLAGLIGLLSLAARAAGLVASMHEFDARLDADPTPLYLMARLVSAASGIATVPALYALGRRAHDHRVGLAAAWLLAVNYLHVRDSHFGVTDVLLTLLVTLGVLCLVRAADSRAMRHFALAGAVIGLAVSTKYNAVLLVLPLGLALLMPGGRPADIVRRAAVAAACLLLAAIATTPYAVLDWPTFIRDVTFEAEHLRQGHAGIDTLVGWRHHAAFTLPIALGIPGLVAAVAGGVASLLRGRHALVVWSFPILYYVVAGSGRVVFVRYMVLLVPFLALGAAVGALLLLERRPLLSRAWMRVAMAVAIAALVGGIPAMRSLAFLRVISQADTRALAARWIDAHAVPGQSLHHSGTVYAHARPTLSLDERLFDARTGNFTDRSGRPADFPDWIVQYHAASPYTPIPAALESIVRECYEQAHVITGVGTVSGDRFDLQDAFFVPYAITPEVERPGPDVVVLAKRAPRCSSSARHDGR